MTAFAKAFLKTFIYKNRHITTTITVKEKVSMYLTFFPYIIEYIWKKVAFY